MARNAHKITSSSEEVVGRSGKLKHITIIDSTSAIINLREVDVSGNVIYKLDVSENAQIHQDLDLGFRTALYAEFVSGTGEINIIYE